MKTTPTGLADLVRAFRELAPQPADCTNIARLLGLKGNIVSGASTAASQPTCRVTQSVATEASFGPSADKEAEDRLPKIIRTRARAPGWQYEPRVEPPGPDVIGRPVKLTELKAPPVGDMPSYVADAEELDFPQRARRLLDPPPLIPRCQLRALVANLLTCRIPGNPDIRQLVSSLARGRLPAVLPREERRGVARRIYLLSDTADSMRLFQRDATALIKALRDVAGPALQDEAVTYGPPAASPWLRTARGDMLLILSDLGIGGGRPWVSRWRRACWRAFVAYHHRRGLRLTALVPFHHQRWPSNLKHRIRIVHWHRPGVAATPASPRHLLRLARVLSLAAVIDPALLRTARMHILPAADAGAEADFTNGPWVAVSNPRVVSLFPRWTTELRSELAVDPKLLETARRLLEQQRLQASDWSRVLFEEEIVYLSLQSKPNDAERLKESLARVIRSLLGRLRNPASARWALCFLEELPESVRQTEAAQLLRAVASIILNTSHAEVAEIAAAQNAKWVFGNNTEVGVLWTGNHIVVREPPLEGDRVLTVPDTWPRVVIVTDLDGPRKKVLRVRPRKPPAWTRATFLPRLLKTAAGAVYQLDDVSELLKTLRNAIQTKQTLNGVVKGRWKSTEHGYHVDIGFDAFLHESDFLLEGIETDHLVGRIVEVGITALNEERQRVSIVLASRFLAPPTPGEIWRELHRCCDANEEVTGLVTAVGQTGCGVNVLGVRAFLPSDVLQSSDIEAGQNLVGQTLSFEIVELDQEKEKLSLSRKTKVVAFWKKLMHAMTAKMPIPGKVEAIVKGGLIVDIGVKAFVPTSHVDFRNSPDLTLYIGNTYDFWIIKLNWYPRVIVLSRRELIEAERAERLQKLLGEIVPGEVRKGTVKNITDFGAFIDLNGIDGLLHVTDMSWGRIGHPSELLNIGQDIDVIVLNVDLKKARVSLGLKQRTANPWDQIETKYPVGAKVKGKVVNVVLYGAFVEMEPGVEGLVHVTELSWTKRVAKPADILKQGQDIEAVVLGINREEQKISLGIRQLEANPWDTADARYPIGMRVQRQVTSLTSYGAFVELEPGIDGMIHISDPSPIQEINHSSEVLKKGDEVEAVVLNVDKVNQRITLGIKQLTQGQ